ncbi:hypothetical protein [Thioalkalivibrio sp. XN8]|uniref:hypothetical protein n=1 Tax=Thioalkalivibrio sp. XN8 TaxID=2712863 RepID=UPI0013EAD4D2|nr:hypothetical protein [Thioalkalivibrio sp. XN8]NGP53845.1 hypothetical protein [Thioalkalivibrio sp. XN8]
MEHGPDILAQLAGLAGREVRYQGMLCTVVDVLRDPPMLVLRPVGAAPVIQADNFGKPMRHAPQLFELPVFGSDGRSLSAELKLVSVAPDPTPAGD